MEHIRPRLVPVTMRLPPTVVTYSNGEGADAGLGISTYVLGARPRAAFMNVPDVLRKLWKLQMERSAKADIFEIEGVGLLAIAHTWPELIAGRPWLHFIDHMGAQMCLIRGSGNSRNGDVIAHFQALSFLHLPENLVVPWHIP